MRIVLDANVRVAPFSAMRLEWFVRGMFGKGMGL
jgi:hypothetical protein